MNSPSNNWPAICCPNATIEQRIASGFCRNVMVNFEGGADPDEYLSKYVIDRVDTVSTAWLGTTMACAECHDHKYDPFTTKDFYRLYASSTRLRKKVWTEMSRTRFRRLKFLRHRKNLRLRNSKSKLLLQKKL